MQNVYLEKKVLLIIMDGVGVAKKSIGNAVTLANPQNLIKLWNSYPHTYLKASSESVGLPVNTNGNSEVGHLNIGAGTIIYQNLPKINKNIENGNFYTNFNLVKLLKTANENNSDIHIMGCFSDGSVHAHINHFLAVLEFLFRNNFRNQIFFHLFTDGRDTPPKSAEIYFNQLQREINKKGIGTIGTICGRSYAMDRNNTWKRTKLAYDLLINGIGNKYSSWKEALLTNYSNNKTDEFIEPSIINSNSMIKDNDCILFMNFRSDRALQLSKAITDPSFANFETKKFSNLNFFSMTEYQKGFPLNVIYPKEYIKIPIGRLISENGLTQLRIAESEKFPHVTYFFNGGVSLKYIREDNIQIESPKVSTYDLKPEMSTPLILDTLSNYIANDKYNLIVVNLANGDMVAHTGNIEATIKAMQVVDYTVAKLVNLMLARNGTILITADHGNAEELINLKTNEIDTEHSENVVPFMVINNKLGFKQLPFGSLCDISPTIIDILNIPKPSEMTGTSLLKGF